MSFAIAKARLEDLPAIKAIADQCRSEIGFVQRSVLEEAINQGRVLVAKKDGMVLGFLHFAITRRGYTTIYEIAVDPRFRQNGIGKALLERLSQEARAAGSSRLRLKCPVDLPANGFYARMGFTRVAVEAGRRRPLAIWEKPLHFPPPSPKFVLTLTNHTNAIRKLIALWDEGGDPRDPFARLIISPLFVQPSTLEIVRRLQVERGAQVFFDSGGYQVQMGKISYEELFRRLLEAYRKHSWADWYVLPDCVPTSGDSEREVENKIRDTLDYARLFLYRMPEGFVERAIGVVHGRTEEQIQRCVETFVQMGLRYLGFGSFGTSGPKGSVNMVSSRSLQLLRILQTMAWDLGLRFHIFGVGGPTTLMRLGQAGIFPDTFDSAGWWKAGAYGNVFFPGRAQIHLTILPTFLAWAVVEKEKERTGHRCPFCEDVRLLRNSRYHRVLHNLSVMLELT